MLPKREHCFFAIVNKSTGQCIAQCFRRKLVGQAQFEDCIGKKSETTTAYIKRVQSERKLQ